MVNTHDLQVLDPASVRLFYHGGILRLAQPDRSWRAARVYRAFPLTDPAHYYGLTDGAGRELGIVVDPALLDEESRRAAETELEQRYFVPVVQRITDIREDYGATIVDAETDRGRKRYVIRSIRDNVVELPGGRLLVTDVDGNRFEIADLHALDARSQNVFLKSM